MHVFLSWSGSRSRELAEIFRKWLPNVIQSAKPFFSERDIGLGLPWREEISEKLKLCKVGMFLITSDNINSPWLIFEAGAMSAERKVCSIFFDHELSEVSGPLEQFQASHFSKDGILRILERINDSLGTEPIERHILLAAFERNWQDLESAVQGVLDAPDTGAKRRFDYRVLNKLSWDDIMNTIGELNRYFSEKNISFDYIISFSDGGLVVADLLHIMFRPGVPVISVLIKRNEALAHGSSRSVNVMYPTKECGLLQGKSVLLLDDVISTGNTIKKVGEYLKEVIGVKEVYTAVLGIAKTSPLRVYHSVFEYEGKCSLPYGDVPRDLPMETTIE